MINYWLKLWSINTDLFKDSIKSIQNWYFDFIELYIVPEVFNKDKFEILKNSKIKIAFHLPHSTHNFNPIDKKNDSEKIWDLVTEYINYLDPFQIVMHPEFWSDINVLKKRLSYFNNSKIIIENMPMKSSIWVYKNLKFYWYNISQINNIKTISNKFCFDFAKAKSSAISQEIDIISFSNKLVEIMNPSYYHISWFLKNTEVDEHYDLWEWDKKLMLFMKNKLIKISNKNTINIVFECKKKNWIKNDLKNLEYFKKL